MRPDIIFFLQKYFSRSLYLLSPILPFVFRSFFYAILLKTYKKNNDRLRSVYGVTLKANWHDATFLMALSGSWGFYLHDFLRNRKVEYAFIDIGANFGLFSAVAMQSNKCKIVVAIEPNPLIFKVLHENINATTSHSRFESFNCAIDAANRRRSLSFNSNNLGRANLLGKGVETIEVECKNFQLLDKIKLYTKDLPIILKIDTEGFEPKVIQEIRRTKSLRESIQYIYIEISPLLISKKDLDKMFAHLSEMGFEKSWQSYGKAQYDALYIKKLS